MARILLSPEVLRRETARLIGDPEAIIGFSGTPENGYCLMYNGKRIVISSGDLERSLDDVSHMIKSHLMDVPMPNRQWS